MGGGRSSTGRMNPALGTVMVGGTVSKIVASRNPAFSSGTFVLGENGWHAYAISDGPGLRALDPDAAPLSTALGVLGMPGMTAYVGLLDIARPSPGRTVVVSSAAGAVGSIVGQLAKRNSCRAVGVAGSTAKCAYVVDELGFDACVNYRSESLMPVLRAACPGGIDVYFDNVGGDVLAAAPALVNPGPRIPLCGLISQYNATEPPTGRNLPPVLVNRVMIQGFIVSDHADRTNDFLRDCTRWFAEGRLKYREDVVVGLERAPEALIGLLRGRNFGKLIVEVGRDPTR